MPRPSTQSQVRLDLAFESRLAALGAPADKAGIALFTVDAIGRFVGWSKDAERMLDDSFAEVRGQPCRMPERPDCKGFGGPAVNFQEDTQR